MRTPLTIILSAFTGALTALLFQNLRGEVRKAKVAPPAAASPVGQPLIRPADRTPEALSPVYRQRRTSIADYTEDEIAAHLDALVKELVQPDLTPLEAARIADILSDTMRSAINYDAYRERNKRKMREARAEQWLSDLDTEGTGRNE